MLNIHITHIKLEGTCSQCGKKETREITLAQYNKLMEREDLIQKIFPPEDGYTPAFREFFLGSHLCEDCWKKLEEQCEEEERMYELPED